MLTIDDIQFQPHPVVPGGIQSKTVLPNGITVSIVAGPGLYGDGEESWEVGAWRGEREWVRLSEYDDVLPWQSREEVNAVLAQLEQLPA